MKRTFFLIIVSTLSLISFSQSVSNNLDIGIFDNGAHGSNAASGAYLEISIRPLLATYGPPPGQPVAEDYGVILVAPKTDFSTLDDVVIVQANSALYGTTATTVMNIQGAIDIGDGNIYWPLALNNTGGMNLSSLTLNNFSFTFTIMFSNAKTPEQFRKVRIVDHLNNSALSAFFGTPVFTFLNVAGTNNLTNNAITVLPVNLINFSGYKNGNKNVLNWTTSTESNNIGFEVQRASDGVNYSSIGFVNSKAPGGNSVSDITYSFDDNNPESKKQYYRLRQADIDGRSKVSNIVVIKGDKSTTLDIGGLFPNPASTQVNVIIDAPMRDDVTVLVMDAGGRTVKQKQVNVDIGSNTVPVEIANLASGSYLVKLICRSSDCVMASGKFNKL